ncbi:hypothetical protein [Bradyrhizobium sp. BWC-3-1]|uniref:head-tail joining protein n=1 Tax=Bradyrhizobium sp. BWC-3-1 TaxID=3080012 RepID=UPI00293E057A|nr:hypothetical protein [Bradyrhizobium sp. BWC-3-1]WOH61909.1 hypothetical protein RX329_18180 [Bradyrhizobium sp. BWC-3-1]
MTSPAWDNLDEFMDTGDFAVPAVVQFQAGGTRDVTGILEDPYLEARKGEFVEDTTVPTFQLPLNRCTGIKRGDSLVATLPKNGGTVTYDIMTRPQPLGDGMAQLELSRA